MLEIMECVLIVEKNVLQKVNMIHEETEGNTCRQKGHNMDL